jgi:hypothetical protein
VTFFSAGALKFVFSFKLAQDSFWAASHFCQHICLLYGRKKNKLLLGRGKVLAFPAIKQ